MADTQSAISQAAPEQPLARLGLEQDLADLALSIMQLTLETGQDQRAGSVRRLLIQLTDFRQTKRRLTAELEQTAAADSARGIWPQLQEIDILLRNLEHHIMLVQARFQQRASA